MANPDAEAMLRIARRDLKAAEVLQDTSIAEANWGFQIQQAVEKALKAWLLSLGDDPPFIHNLTSLFGRLADAGESVEGFLPLEAFTAFAVQFRYDAEPESMELDRQLWHQQAVALVDHVAEVVRSTP
ncbi:MULTISPECIES: HEPN domain-containing protein [unclassified Synechococcus]|jgi:HEPN domain-containing protein|uniref:HEPN domain-containing protein n=1 Tax=unclassified Synechococcus TaxID=2626047 RepID=UPI0018CC8B2D|nr:MULTISPECIES: HEPN domain-containing protein [unclassified Synechococcus]MEA5421756.1 HEPN domain-containing protein [Synechococcus sp. CCY9202]QPN60563.1 HEPN domain-containing protein [Synechococcus sp. CBW1002]QPN67726.1 HEPN domain-containing protein [Synechococcus sp. CBW1006]